MKTTIAALLLLTLTASGCSLFQPPPDGGPSQAEVFLDSVSTVAPAFGPGGIMASTVLGGVAGVLEILRRREASKKQQTADLFRYVAAKIDQLKDEDVDAARKLVGLIKSGGPKTAAKIDTIRQGGSL